MTWSDQIFHDFRQGKIEGFYKYIYPDILVYAASLLKGEGAISAEDCVQDAVEASYRRKEQFVTAMQWHAFIIACVRNKAISIQRHNEAQGNYLNSIDNNDYLTGDSLNDFIEVETKIRLYNAINSLPNELRQIFILNFEEGLKNAEIAQQLGVAEITIKKRKARLISRLRDLLGHDDDLFLILLFLLLE